MHAATDTAPRAGKGVAIQSDGRFWLAEELEPSSWLLEPSEAVRAEISAMVAVMRRRPLPLLLDHPERFDLEHCRRLMDDVRRRLEVGIGFVVVGDAFADIAPEEAKAAFWVLGQLLSRPVATKWDGTMTYDVRDAGKPFGPGVRGSAANVELSFHTDNSFGVAPPDFVGLLCLQPSPNGGVSRVSSLLAAYERLRLEAPAAFERLHWPCWFDKQAEHAPGEPDALEVPIFEWKAGRLRSRVTPGLVRRAHLRLGLEDPVLFEGLERLERLLADQGAWVEFTLARHQMQFVDNHACAHFRSAFTDPPPGAPPRHLIRVWYRDQGAIDYDGW